MVTFKTSEYFSEELRYHMLEYKEELEQLQFSGKLNSYALSEDLSVLWMTFIAEHESDLLRIIHKLSFTAHMEFDYHELIYQETIYHLPALSLN